METNRKVTIKGKVYKLVPKGSYHCRDCDAFSVCVTDGCFNVCAPSYSERYLLRYSQSLTDKLNQQ